MLPSGQHQRPATAAALWWDTGADGYCISSVSIHSEQYVAAEVGEGGTKGRGVRVRAGGTLSCESAGREIERKCGEEGGWASAKSEQAVVGDGLWGSVKEPAGFHTVRGAPQRACTHPSPSNALGCCSDAPPSLPAASCPAPPAPAAAAVLRALALLAECVLCTLTLLRLL